MPIHATLKKSKAASAEESGGTGCSRCAATPAPLPRSAATAAQKGETTRPSEETTGSKAPFPPTFPTPGPKTKGRRCGGTPSRWCAAVAAWFPSSVLRGGLGGGSGRFSTTERQTSHRRSPLTSLHFSAQARCLRARSPRQEHSRRIAAPEEKSSGVSGSRQMRQQGGGGAVPWPPLGEEEEEEEEGAAWSPPPPSPPPIPFPLPLLPPPRPRPRMPPREETRGRSDEGLFRSEEGCTPPDSTSGGEEEEGEAEAGGGEEEEEEEEPEGTTPRCCWWFPPRPLHREEIQE